MKKPKKLIVGGLLIALLAVFVGVGANTNMLKGSVVFTPMTLTEVTPADGSLLTETTEFSVVTNVPAICSYRVLRRDTGYPYSRVMNATQQEDGSYKHSVIVRSNPSSISTVTRYIKCSDHYVNVKEVVLNLTMAPTPVITAISPTDIQYGDVITVTGRNFNSLVRNPDSDEFEDRYVRVKFDDYVTGTVTVSDTEIRINAVDGIPRSSRLTLVHQDHPETYFITSDQILTYLPEGETRPEPVRLTLTNLKPNGTVNSTTVFFSVDTNLQATCTYRSSHNLSGSTQYPMTVKNLSDGTQSHYITMNINGADSSTMLRGYIRCTDAAGDTAEAQVSYNINVPVAADTNAPMLTVEKIGVLPVGTTGTTLRVATDEAATCTYRQMGLSLTDSTSRMGSSDGLNHSANLIGLTAGKYAYQITCADRSSNVSKPVSIEFEIKAGSTLGIFTK